MKRDRSFRALPFLSYVAVTCGVALLLSGASGCGGGNGSDYDPDRPPYDTPTMSIYKTARCTDGSYTYSKQPEIFCASRGGIDQRYDRPK